jgi:hypothetical protein
VLGDFGCVGHCHAAGFSSCLEAMGRARGAPRFDAIEDSHLRLCSTMTFLRVK